MRLIDAHVLDMYFLNQVFRKQDWKYYEIDDAIEKQPTVDAMPVKYGRWIRNDKGTYSCSKCQSWIPNEQYYYARYCLHCGAKMEK